MVFDASIIKSLLKSNWFLFQLARRVFRNPILGFFDFLWMILYSYYVSFLIFGFSFFPKVYFSDRVFSVYVSKGFGSKVFSGGNGLIVFESFLGGNSLSSFILGGGAKLTIHNPLIIGDGCRILILDDAELCFFGNGNSSASGITSDSKIICRKKITIGMGVIISWNVFISDSSNHSICGSIRIADVFIGDNVWISEGVSVGPGSIVGSGSIIGSKSFVSGVFPDNTLIAGCPAVIKKNNIYWER